MKLLIVEDDPHKMKAIQQVLEPGPGIAIQTATSLRSAMTELEAVHYDAVILDMAIPSHTSDAGAIDTYSQPVGGLDVLLFLASNCRNEKVVVLTQYPTVEYDRRHVPLKYLREVLHGDEIHNFVDALHFDDDGHWRAALLTAVGNGQ